VLAVVLCTCSEDVEIGRYLTRADAGLDGGGLDDGGTSADDGGLDGGLVDGGARDAGETDAGANDAGTNDAGETDAGANDGGAPDGGDGGTSDAGLDGGVAELSVLLSGEWVFPVDAGPTVWQISLRNDGPVRAPAPVVVVNAASGLTLVSPDCADAGPGPDGGQSLRCFTADVLPGGVASVSLQLEPASLVPRLYDVSVVALAATGETNLGDNTARLPVALTPGSAVVSPFAAPRSMSLITCVGTNITSFAQCVPGSRLFYDIAFEVDGGWFPNDSGIPGRWGLGAGGRSLVLMNLLLPTRGPNGFVGAATTATCFEGVTQNTAGNPFAGAWQGCLR